MSNAAGPGSPTRWDTRVGVVERDASAAECGRNYEMDH